MKGNLARLPSSNLKVTEVVPDQKIDAQLGSSVDSAELRGAVAVHSWQLVSKLNS